MRRAGTPGKPCSWPSRRGTRRRRAALAVDQERKRGNSYQQAYAAVYSHPDNQALREKVKAEHLEGTLRGVGDRVTVGQWSVSLSRAAALQDRFERLYPAQAPGQMRIPTYVMESGAVDLRNSKEGLTLELLACNTPFESLEEMCNELNMPIAPGELTQPTRAEIILGTLFRFDDTSTLKDDHLNLKIVAPREVKQEHLKISAKVTRESVKLLEPNALV